jgi:hypothetical protein
MAPEHGNNRAPSKEHRGRGYRDFALILQGFPGRRTSAAAQCPSKEMSVRHVERETICAENDQHPFDYHIPITDEPDF